ncbi:MAG: hypothetical protein WEH44_02055, partial [Pirellulaceae bacterium]
YPIGSNAINDRTIGESAQGLATYVSSTLTRSASEGKDRLDHLAIPDAEKKFLVGVKAQFESEVGRSALSCAIAYDTRHNSRHFAELCASVMVASGFTVYFLDDYRSTPELSFLVRYKQCACGIMVTASHNPPSDNAVKVYWSTGGQIVPPHDKAIVECVMNVQEIRTTDFQAAVNAGKVIICTEEVDRAYLAAVAQQKFAGPRDLDIIYTPLHGVGAASVVPALRADGFKSVEVYGPHSLPSGDFPNVPGHVSNPENPEVFDKPISLAMSRSADLIMATDPDGDRMGCAAPVSRVAPNPAEVAREAAARRVAAASGTAMPKPAATPKPVAPWKTLTGNQLGVLLADYVCEQRKKSGGLTKEHYLVTTLVTTRMIRRIGDSYGVRVFDNLHVGFKWIAQ